VVVLVEQVQQLHHTTPAIQVDPGVVLVVPEPPVVGQG